MRINGIILLVNDERTPNPLKELEVQLSICFNGSVPV